MTAYEVVHYLADTTKWGAEKTVEISPRGMRYNVLLETFSEFQNRAKEGSVSAIGRLNGFGQHVAIPASIGIRLLWTCLRHFEMGDKVERQPLCRMVKAFRSTMTLE